MNRSARFGHRENHKGHSFEVGPVFRHASLPISIPLLNSSSAGWDLGLEDHI